MIIDKPMKPVQKAWHNTFVYIHTHNYPIFPDHQVDSVAVIFQLDTSEFNIVHKENDYSISMDASGKTAIYYLQFSYDHPWKTGGKN